MHSFARTTAFIFAYSYLICLLPAVVLSDPVKRDIGLFDTIVPNSYIVTLKPSSSVSQFLDLFENTVKASSGEANVVYEHPILNGFSGVFTGGAFDFLKNYAGIEAIYPDGVVTISDHQVDADWGLQRISQRSKLTRSDTAATDYTYDYLQPAGANTFIYVIDTGIMETHVDFGGRAKLVAQFGGYQLHDGNGHGTHVAGIAAGTRWGVSKNAQIRGIKVLSDAGSGAVSDIIAAIDYVVQQCKTQGPCVINMSLGGGSNTAFDTAVNNAVAAGVHVAVAAVNSNADACQTSPARASNANTVAASNINDERASYSNFGTCVDVFAPGSDITSSWIGSNTATNTISGTSMATPHVTGLISYLLSFKPGTTPSAMSATIRKMATFGALDMKQTGLAGGLTSISNPTPNYLIYDGGLKFRLV